jgi:hypothetical protein
VIKKKLGFEGQLSLGEHGDRLEIIIREEEKVEYFC